MFIYRVGVDAVVSCKFWFVLFWARRSKGRLPPRKVLGQAVAPLCTRLVGVGRSCVCWAGLAQCDARLAVWLKGGCEAEKANVRTGARSGARRVVIARSCARNDNEVSSGRRGGVDKPEELEKLFLSLP